MEEVLSAELVENLVDFGENRARVYTLLSRCYEREIDASFAADMSECVALEAEDPALAEEFAALQSELRDADEAKLEHLAVVFNRVFFGMGPRTAQKAFPYESVYTSAGGLMMQEAYSKVVHLYREANFEKNPDFKEPEDHLAVELAFMALLCERAAQALRAGDEAGAETVLRDQLAFLREHLLNWISSFTRDAKASAEGGFYAHLVAFTEAYLKDDEGAVAEVLD